ncbi:SRPBCC domain-containing protein [Nocardioides sp. WL0053]|uniref:SRPBCC domain-containing protein n=1 Tax=Nocardioides jiangsuensis TaxID=2866161 RepID=A0ABS7RPI0_9ACTN|nr:SRPBCC domain-containing protein [Nocardioides jiangsuensis]MBY9076866.1 SRPBCC domain-containing protein [Nocardioides jiangsuensis]
MTQVGPGGTEPLTKHVDVPLAVSAAFERFTAGMADWWPLETHSVWERDAVRVGIDGRVGGHLAETHRDGRTAVWGTVLRWEPPRLVAFTWHPGRPEREATQVTVRFTPHGTGTRVELTHGGWEARDDSAYAVIGYDRGWERVLDRLAAGAP